MPESKEAFKTHGDMSKFYKNWPEEVPIRQSGGNFIINEHKALNFRNKLQKNKNKKLILKRRRIPAPAIIECLVELILLTTTEKGG